MFTGNRLAAQIAEMPLLDHHCHAPLRLPQAISAPEFRAPFTESALAEVQVNDVPETLAYRAMLRWLASLLSCEPNEDAVLAARAEYEPEAYHRMLADDAGLGTLLADHLFAEAHSYAPEEWATLIGRPVHRVLRVETVAERLLPAATSWEALRQEFSQSLVTSASRGVVAFKSIAAYRSGLDVQPVDAATASAALDAVRAEIEAGEFTRLTNKPLIDALLWETLEVAAQLSLPLQFHVGLGDDDVVLPASNPTLLRAVFREPRYRHVPIVLLHNYPYVREAAYLASIYPNAYVDLGLTVPLAGPDCDALIREALGLAPVSKVLASTDGHGTPEFQWFAARLWRVSLARVLDAIIEADMMDHGEAVAVASRVLHANAETLYRL